MGQHVTRRLNKTVMVRKTAWHVCHTRYGSRSPMAAALLRVSGFKGQIESGCERERERERYCTVSPNRSRDWLR